MAHQDIAQELMHLQEKETRLDKLIQNCTLQIYQLFENQHAQRYPSAASQVLAVGSSLAVLLASLGCCACASFFYGVSTLTLKFTFAYLTYEDLSRIPNYKEQTVMVIKAPAGTQLDVPHPDEVVTLILESASQFRVGILKSARPPFSEGSFEGRTHVRLPSR